MIQSIVYGVLAAAWISLVAVGFGLTLRCVRFFNFAHAIVFAGAAYFAYLLRVWLALPLIVSCALAIVMGTVLGCLLEILVYRPLRRRNSSPLGLLLASIGCYAVLQHLIEIIFGKDTKTVRSGVEDEGFYALGMHLTSIQLLTILIGFGVVMSLAVSLQRTRLGAQVRAVADDFELASICGVSPDRVILWIAAISSALAALAGILVALDVDMTPMMGMHALMMAVVAAIIGGSGHIWGVIASSLFLGLVLHVGPWQISSTWQDAVAFMILIGFLLLRPEGFLFRTPKTIRV